MAKKEKAGKPNQNKKNSTKVLQVPIRVEIKPDGRVVWNVQDVHKTIAKQIAKDQSLSGCTQLVKKDSTSISLVELRNSQQEVVKSKEGKKPTTTESKDKVEVKSPVEPQLPEVEANPQQS